MNAYAEAEPDWDAIRGTLLAKDDPRSRSAIDGPKADLIIALLKTGLRQNAFPRGRLDEVVDALKLISIDIHNSKNLEENLNNIADALNIPVVEGESPTEATLRWWRMIIQILAIIGVSFAAINTIVPIDYKLILQGLFIGGQALASGFTGTGALSAASSAASSAGPSMVAGPSMAAVQSVLGIISSITKYTLVTCGSAAAAAAAAAARAAASVARGVCALLTIPNAESLAELAAHAAMATGIGYSMTFFLNFNAGVYDKAIAYMIDNNIFQNTYNDLFNELINHFLESSDTIYRNKVEVKMRDKVGDRQLEPSIQDMIEEEYNKLLEKAVQAEIVVSSKHGRPDRNIHVEIINELDSLNNPKLANKNEMTLIVKYGVALVTAYRLNNIVVSNFNRFGRDPHGTSSQPDPELEKMPLIRSVSMPANRKEPLGENQDIVGFYLKKEILTDIGFENSLSKFTYIPIFNKKMSKCMEAVLGQLFDPNRPSMGNIFTAIEKMEVSADIQTQISTQIQEGCDQISGDYLIDETLIQRIAADVRKKINLEVLSEPEALGPPAEALRPPQTKASGPSAVFDVSKIPIPPSRSGNALNKRFEDRMEKNKKEEREARERVTEERLAAARLAEEERLAAEREARERLAAEREAALTAAEAARRTNREKNENRDRHDDMPGGRRRSRRYKKRRSTLKRRRIKRRRTRKGKKRRHTKRRR